jgi:hypothetical protein
MTVGALDETDQEKQGTATARVKRQYMGCAGRVANASTQSTCPTCGRRPATPWPGHGSGSRPGTSRTRSGRWSWGLPLDLRFRTKGQLAADILADAYGDGLSFDFVCGDEVYGSCTELRRFLEDSGQAYVLRVSSCFLLTLTTGAAMTCADAVKTLLKHDRRWEIRSAGSGSKGDRWYAWRWEIRSAGSGSKGDRWYAWAWIGTASPRHSLLVRRYLKTGGLAYCYLLRARRAARVQDTADQGRGAALVGGGKLRVRKRLCFALRFRSLMVSRIVQVDRV